MPGSQQTSIDGFLVRIQQVTAEIHTLEAKAKILRQNVVVRESSLKKAMQDPQGRDSQKPSLRAWHKQHVAEYNGEQSSAQRRLEADQLFPVKDATERLIASRQKLTGNRCQLDSARSKLKQFLTTLKGIVAAPSAEPARPRVSDTHSTPRNYSDPPVATPHGAESEEDKLRSVIKERLSTMAQSLEMRTPSTVRAGGASVAAAPPRMKSDETETGATKKGSKGDIRDILLSMRKAIETDVLQPDGPSEAAATESTLRPGVAAVEQTEAALRRRTASSPEIDIAARRPQGPPIAVHVSSSGFQGVALELQSSAPQFQKLGRLMEMLPSGKLKLGGTAAEMGIKIGDPIMRTTCSTSYTITCGECRLVVTGADGGPGDGLRTTANVQRFLRAARDCPTWSTTARPEVTALLMAPLPVAQAAVPSETSASTEGDVETLRRQLQEQRAATALLEKKLASFENNQRASDAPVPDAPSSTPAPPTFTPPAPVPAPAPVPVPVAVPTPAAPVRPTPAPVCTPIIAAVATKAQLPPPLPPPTPATVPPPIRQRAAQAEPPPPGSLPVKHSQNVSAAFSTALIARGAEEISWVSTTLVDKKTRVLRVPKAEDIFRDSVLHTSSQNSRRNTDRDRGDGEGYRALNEKERARLSLFRRKYHDAEGAKVGPMTDAASVFHSKNFHLKILGMSSLASDPAPYSGVANPSNVRIWNMAATDDVTTQTIIKPKVDQSLYSFKRGYQYRCSEKLEGLFKRALASSLTTVASIAYMRSMIKGGSKDEGHYVALWESRLKPSSPLPLPPTF